MRTKHDPILLKERRYGISKVGLIWNSEGRKYFVFLSSILEVHRFTVSGSIKFYYWEIILNFQYFRQLFLHPWYAKRTYRSASVGEKQHVCNKRRIFQQEKCLYTIESKKKSSFSKFCQYTKTFLQLTSKKKNSLRASSSINRCSDCSKFSPIWMLSARDRALAPAPERIWI